MNILFVNYGDFTTNSLNHIGGFANALCGLGHQSAVAVANHKETVRCLDSALFIPATYDEALADPGLFPDGRPADLIHAWTPREGVRKFVVAYQRAIAHPARLIIHLEDNERHLIESYTGKSFDALENASREETASWLIDPLSHPLRYRSFLQVADGVTLITERLRELVPGDLPATLIMPGVDFSIYHEQQPDPALRSELGLGDAEKVIAFTGSSTFANEREIRDLYEAVALLNQRGIRTKLLRTGFHSANFSDGLGEAVLQHVVDMGFVEKRRLPRILALADVLVQPGQVGEFNDYRLPSKIPEFLAMGKPTVLPATNLALLLRDEQDAMLLRSGTAEEIADVCESLFEDPARCTTLGRNATAFARSHFDTSTNTAELLAFYERVLSTHPRTDWQLVKRAGASDVTLIADYYRKASSSRTEPGMPVPDLDLLYRLISDLEGSVVHSDRIWLELEAEVKNVLERERLTAQHAKNLEAAVKALSYDLHVLRDSWPWGITMPLRWIAAAVRQIRQSKGSGSPG